MTTVFQTWMWKAQDSYGKLIECQPTHPVWTRMNVIPDGRVVIDNPNAHLPAGTTYDPINQHHGVAQAMDAWSAVGATNFLFQNIDKMVFGNAKDAIPGCIEFPKWEHGVKQAIEFFESVATFSQDMPVYKKMSKATWCQDAEFGWSHHRGFGVNGWLNGIIKGGRWNEIYMFSGKIQREIPVPMDPSRDAWDKVNATGAWPSIAEVVSHSVAAHLKQALGPIRNLGDYAARGPVGNYACIPAGVFDQNHPEAFITPALGTDWGEELCSCPVFYKPTDVPQTLRAISRAVNREHQIMPWVILPVTDQEAEHFFGIVESCVDHYVNHIRVFGEQERFQNPIALNALDEVAKRYA